MGTAWETETNEKLWEAYENKWRSDPRNVGISGTPILEELVQLDPEEVTKANAIRTSRTWGDD